MKTDLHIHSSFSDGQYSPKEILNQIIDNNIKEFSITDHDTIKGAIIMKDLVKNENLVFRMGVEISTRIEELKVNVHILCYDFDEKNFEVLNILEDLHNKRLNKLDLIIDFVKENFNFIITEEKKQELLKNNYIVGKPHVYTLLNEYKPIEKETYYNIMNNLNSESTKVDAIKTIKVFHNAGGKVVLAHPKEIEKEYNIDSEIVIKYLKNYNLDGLETEHSTHTKEDIKRFKILAKKYNLFETCGSDYHGEKVKEDIKIGVCEKN